MKKVELTMKEEKYYEVIKDYANKRINKHRAMIKTGLSERHVNRLRKRYLEEGKKAFSHKSKGVVPKNKISEETRNMVVSIYTEKFEGGNFKHFTEYLNEIEKIKISYSSVRNILMENLKISPMAYRITRKKHKKHLRAIERSKKTTLKEKTVVRKELQKLEFGVDNIHPVKPKKKYFGEEIQIDGTPHDWVIGVGKWTLHLAVDNATGTVVAGHFEKTECLNGYFEILEQIVTKYGIPNSFKSDNHTIFNYLHKKSASCEDTFTQFAYACNQLGIQLNTTSIPQAKGQIERLNKSFQSRLPIEFRLNDIKTIEEANNFLPSFIEDYNKRFALPVNDNTSVFVPQVKKEELLLVISRKYQRKVLKGFIFKFENKTYEIVDKEGKKQLYRSGKNILVIQPFRSDIIYVTIEDKVYIAREIESHEKYSKEFDKEVQEKKEHYDLPKIDTYSTLSTFVKFLTKIPHQRKNAEKLIIQL